MLPFDTTVSPAVAGVLSVGIVRPCGVLATLIELASQNGLSVYEQEAGRYSFKIDGPKADNLILTDLKKSLLNWRLIVVT